MKLITGILIFGMATGSTLAQNPEIIQNTRNQLKAAERKKTADSNAALESMQASPATRAASLSAKGPEANLALLPLDAAKQEVVRNAHTVERGLQFLQIPFISTVARNRNFPADAHQCAAEWLRDHAAIPGLQNPGTVECNVKNGHGNAGTPRQHHWPRLSNIARTFGAVDGECGRPALLKLPPHAE